MKIVQAFSGFGLNGVFGGSDFSGPHCICPNHCHDELCPVCIPNEPAASVGFEFPTILHVTSRRMSGRIVPDGPAPQAHRDFMASMQTLEATQGFLEGREINMQYGTSTGVSLGRGWVEASVKDGEYTVRSRCCHYDLTNVMERYRAEAEVRRDLMREFQHHLAEVRDRGPEIKDVGQVSAVAVAEQAAFKRATMSERIKLAMCEKCGHAVLLHGDYTGCKHEADGGGLCHCLEGCKPPPVAPARSRANLEAVAEQANAEIKRRFVVAQREGVRAKLQELGCPLHIAVMIVAGISFTENQRDPAMLGKWAYVAGPMRGKPDFNFPEFDRARDVLLKEGWNVISPADIDRGDKGEPNPVERTHLYALRDFWCIYLLSQWGEGNTENQQFICFLDGWEHSAGAAAEAFLARWLSLRPLRVESKLVAKPITERPWVNIVREFAAPVV